MHKIGFIIKRYSGKSQYYNSNVKPFVDLSYGLNAMGYEVSLFIDESERHLDEKIKSITGDGVTIFYFQRSNIEKLIYQNSIKYLIVEDNIDIMETVLKFQSKEIKKAVFVQYLYGVNTNKPEKRMSSFDLTIGSYLPWRLLTKKYRNLIERFDYIIPNSQTCGYILRQFYGLSPSGIVYPPVGIDMRPLLDNIKEKVEKKGILIFAGNIENDYFSRDIKKEVKTLISELKEPVKLFVSNPETASYFSQDGIKLYSRLSVSELVKLYSESRATYVPTEYELFGYVGAESLLCGTPVILDVFHPFLESFPMETNTVKIVHPLKTIFSSFFELQEEKSNMAFAQAFIYNRYSAVESAKLLASALEL